jgi:UDP-glucose:(heptosyl)LPS alpha-1,3-glucosyltransferase
LIGNDWKKKGLDTLLEALALCHELPVRLLVVGKDSAKAHQQRCEELHLESRVNFLAPSADVMQFYAACDAYAGPSLEDAYGLPILESMACGLPVIVSAAAGASEIISDGENGLLLANPRDARNLARLMRRLCSSQELCRALGEAAEKTAARESWEAHAARSYEHFSQIIASKAGESNSN